MRPFDRAKWLERARRRLAAARGGKEAALATHARDYASIDGIQRVVAWAAGRKIDVVFTKVQAGRFHPETRRVDVSAHAPPETQLYVMLHELGHFLVGEEGDGYQADAYPNGYRKVAEDVPGRGRLHKVDVVAEEFEAWRRGLVLAQELGVPIDRLRYDEVRAEYLVSYFKWALRRGRVSDGG